MNAYGSLAADTMEFISKDFYDASAAIGHPIAIQPEDGPSLKGLEWILMGWGCVDADQVTLVSPNNCRIS